MSGLDEKLIAAWRQAGANLGVRVIAPHTLRGSDGQTVECEAFLPDFGSPTGAVIVSLRTERRERAKLRSVPDLWCSVAPRRGVSVGADVLEDFEWFGPADQAPSWYRAKSGWDRSRR
jgi:hypothetical protein